MYVGSHTWDGPEGAVDEDYHGSSVIACKYGWVPVEVSILEVVSEERKYVAEREWILKYCNEFGVHPIVKKLHPDFGLQFKTGVLIKIVRGSVYHCCSVVGSPNWSQSVSFKLRSNDEVEHRGYTFRLIYI